MQSVLDEKLDFSKEEALIISREIKTGGLGIELSESVALSVCSCLESNWTPEILENIERSIEFNRFGLSMSEELSNSILSNLPHEFLSKNHDMLKSKCKSVNEFKENQFELKKDVSKELLKNSLGKYKFDLSTINPDEISKILGCEVEYCFEENGVYSISYLESENLMLVYECDNQSKIDNFSGWLSEEGGLNKACVSKIRVYTVSAEYPQVLDVLDSNHSDFSKLPLYIRVGIQDQGLDVSSFIHENELNFIFGDEGIMSDLFAFYQNDTSKLEILEKMESIMKTCLIKKGESIKISTNDDQDKSIKDNINDVCNQLMDNLKTIIGANVQKMPTHEQFLSQFS